MSYDSNNIGGSDACTKSQAERRADHDPLTVLTAALWGDMSNDGKGGINAAKLAQYVLDTLTAAGFAVVRRDHETGEGETSMRERAETANPFQGHRVQVIEHDGDPTARWTAECSCGFWSTGAGYSLRAAVEALSRAHLDAVRR